MTKQRALLSELIQKYQQNNNIRGVLVYGSVAKETETEDSDIDLWIFNNNENNTFVHSIDTIKGIKLDLFEISVSMAEKFITSGEAPIINALLTGKFLYTKDLDTDKLIHMAKDKKTQKYFPIEEIMPEDKIIFRLYQMYNSVEDAKKAVEDKIKFRLVFSEVIMHIYNNLYEFYGIWPESTQNTLPVFEKELPDIYPIFKEMLDDGTGHLVQVENAEKIVNLLAEKYGGIPSKYTFTSINN